MALSKDVTYKGIQVKNCYIRIWKFEGNKNLISVIVGYHANADSSKFDNKTIPNIPYDIGNGDPLAQAYSHIKLMPEFENCIDV